MACVDATFQQRILIIPFEKLEMTEIDYENNMQWNAASRMLSCLQPDIENLVLEGHKIPLAAMQESVKIQRVENDLLRERIARLERGRATPLRGPQEAVALTS